ncbi:hypothetical protein B0H19DRAFT_1149885 [Mycena capillaripes]|nr:hypothetical protein B0H19DRAFT_1149885 [Mycena capillaripes]
MRSKAFIGVLWRYRERRCLMSTTVLNESTKSCTCAGARKYKCSTSSTTLGGDTESDGSVGRSTGSASDSSKSMQRSTSVLRLAHTPRCA